MSGVSIGSGVVATDISTSFVVQAQIGIPLILPSSGSIGNNGALSGLTALPLTYANCYMYFPANAIVAGSAAGWYYVVMSSTTAGTIYNNTYSSGKPSIPASPTAFATTGPGAYTQVVTEQTAHSITIPARAMGNQGRLKSYALISFPNNANNKIFKTKFGTTTFISSTVTTNLAQRIEGVISNVTLSSQIFPASTSGISAGTGQSGTAVTGSSENTAVDLTTSITLQLANAADYLIVNSCSWETAYSL